MWMTVSGPRLSGRVLLGRKANSFNQLIRNIVMAGLDPAIHALPFRTNLAMSTLRHRVDGRVKDGHDNTNVGAL
jgi:hypothetical protein